VQCLAVLSTNDRLKLEIAARGGLRLLSAASCSADTELQQAAADAVANMCTDTAIIHVVRANLRVACRASAPPPHTSRERMGLVHPSRNPCCSCLGSAFEMASSLCRLYNAHCPARSASAHAADDGAWGGRQNNRW
jgi:hypothetical protein